MHQPSKKLKCWHQPQRPRNAPPAPPAPYLLCLLIVEFTDPPGATDAGLACGFVCTSLIPSSSSSTLTSPTSLPVAAAGAPHLAYVLGEGGKQDCNPEFCIRTPAGSSPLCVAILRRSLLPSMDICAPAPNPQWSCATPGSGLVSGLNTDCPMKPVPIIDDAKDEPPPGELPLSILGVCVGGRLKQCDAPTPPGGMGSGILPVASLIAYTRWPACLLLVTHQDFGTSRWRLSAVRR
jgi:hypothetical protein